MTVCYSHWGILNSMSMYMLFFSLVSSVCSMSKINDTELIPLFVFEDRARHHHVCLLSIPLAQNPNDYPPL